MCFHFWSGFSVPHPDLFFLLLWQMSALFSVPAVFLVLVRWHLLCALCARARSLTYARRITTAKHPTASSSTTTRELSGQALQKVNQLKHQETVFISCFALLQMSQEGDRGCCICGPFSTWNYWRYAFFFILYWNKNIYGDIPKPAKCFENDICIKGSINIIFIKKC